MNEITRIHLAKTPYDIEIEAKKSLQHYLDSLATYTKNADVLEDIEIRMTELLSERGIDRNGLITLADVDAIREQLGEPKDFIDPTDEKSTDTITDSNESGARKLFRDPGTAIVGGVLSGIAQYLRVDAIWVRLAFLVLAIISGGAVLLIYVVLWIFIPPVRTAADKLRLHGRSVTAAAIHELSEREGPFTQDRDKRVLRILTIALGIGFSIAAFVALLATVVAGIQIGLRMDALLREITTTASVYAAIGLAITSGLLLTILFIITAHAAFSRRISRKHIIAASIVTVLGLTTFGTAVGIGIFTTNEVQRQINDNAVERTVPLEASFNSIKKIKLEGSQNTMSFSYVVSDDAPRYVIEQRTLKKQNIELPTLAINGDTATIKLPTSKELNYSTREQYNVTMYGPALTDLTLIKGSAAQYATTTQQSISVNLEADAHLDISGVIDSLNLTLVDTAGFNGNDASINHPTVNSSNGGQATFGTIETLSITARSSCGAISGVLRLDADQVTNQSFVLNGQSIPNSSIDQNCIHVDINEDSEFEHFHRQ